MHDEHHDHEQDDAHDDRCRQRFERVFHSRTPLRSGTAVPGKGHYRPIGSARNRGTAIFWASGWPLGQAQVADQAGAVGEAAAYCVRLLRRYDPDRLATLTFVPPPRAALLALYAFNADIARLRDAVREPLVRELRLKWWREAVAGAAAQRVQPKPEVRLLREGLAQGRLAESAMQRLIDGWSRDFAAAADTLADAERRGGDTAGLLLEAVLGALGVSEPAAQAAAHHIGTAWALLELVRAVPSDARLGRCRLPLDLLRDHGLSAAAVAAGTRG
ncbi:MAG: hypothetical protein FJX56_12840, partial [Alphaproteobacteria bacterium]|nr:hypothetical protein [Alphaproteobacteria bacterium]